VTSSGRLRRSDSSAAGIHRRKRGKGFSFEDEEGTVIMELKLDPEWCVRKATIVQSTGFWRLDRVSLSCMMTVKYMPKPESIKQTDGEPTVTVKLGWGASQGKH